MKYPRLLPAAVSLVVAVCAQSAVHGAGVFQVLPKGSAWATYHFRIVNPNTETTGTFTYSLLARKIVKGKAYRKLQYKMTVTSTDKPQTIVMQALVPEKELLTTHGFGTALRSVIVFADGKRREADSFSTIERKLPLNLRRTGVFVLAASGFYRDAGKAGKPQTPPAKTVDYQRGKLTSDKGVFGPFVFTQKVPVVNNGKEKAAPFVMRSNLTVWRSAKVPFGTAVITLKESWSIDGMLQGTKTVECTVIDFGTGTKNLLPGEKSKR